MNDKERLWARRINEWQQSDLSQRKFCEQQKLALSTFQLWRRRLKRNNEQPKLSTFVELPIEQSGNQTDKPEPALRLNIRGYTITITGSVDQKQLRTVLDVLEGR